jgi:hypothetical protein
MKEGTQVCVNSAVTVVLRRCYSGVRVLLCISRAVGVVKE